MADFIHAKEYLNQDDIVIVNCSHQCNVMLMTDSNFQCYRTGRKFEYFGGFYQYFPVKIAVPHSGHWNVVIDLGGGSARIRYSIEYIKN